MRHADILDCIADLRRHIAEIHGSSITAEAFVGATLYAFTEDDFVVTDVGSMRGRMLDIFQAIWMTTSGQLQYNIPAEPRSPERAISANPSPVHLNDTTPEEARPLPHGTGWPVTYAEMAALADLGLEPVEVARYLRVTTSYVFRRLYGRGPQDGPLWATFGSRPAGWLVCKALSVRLSNDSYTPTASVAGRSGTDKGTKAPQRAGLRNDRWRSE
jgi:hypothetical protein